MLPESPFPWTAAFLRNDRSRRQARKRHEGYPAGSGVREGRVTFQKLNIKINSLGEGCLTRCSIPSLFALVGGKQHRLELFDKTPLDKVQNAKLCGEKTEFAWM